MSSSAPSMRVLRSHDAHLRTASVEENAGSKKVEVVAEPRKRPTRREKGKAKATAKDATPKGKKRGRDDGPSTSGSAADSCLRPRKAKKQSRNIRKGDHEDEALTVYVRTPCKCKKLKLLWDLKVSKEHLKILSRCGILHLQSLDKFVVYTGYLEHLLRRWDQKQEGFRFGSVFVSFSIEDVERITGFANKGEVFDVCVAPYESSWAKRCLHGRRPDLDTVYSLLVEAVKGTSARAINDACRLFILYILGRVCFPLTNDLWPGNICDLLEDLDRVKHWNWAAMLHRFLLLYINQTAPLAIDRGKGNLIGGGNLCGPGWILQVWLFEHTKIWIGKPFDARQPRFRRWLGDDLKLSLMPGHMMKCSLLRADVEQVMNNINETTLRVDMEGVPPSRISQVGSSSCMAEGSNEQATFNALVLGKLEMQGIENGKLRGLLQELRSQVDCLQSQVDMRDARVEDLEAQVHLLRARLRKKHGRKDGGHKDDKDEEEADEAEEDDAEEEDDKEEDEEEAGEEEQAEEEEDEEEEDDKEADEEEEGEDQEGEDEEDEEEQDESCSEYEMGSSSVDRSDESSDERRVSARMRESDIDRKLERFLATKSRLRGFVPRRQLRQDSADYDAGHESDHGHQPPIAHHVSDHVLHVTTVDGGTMIYATVGGEGESSVMRTPPQAPAAGPEDVMASVGGEGESSVMRTPPQATTTGLEDVMATVGGEGESSGLRTPTQATTAGVEDVMDFLTPMDRVTLHSFRVHDPDQPMRMNDLSDPSEETTLHVDATEVSDKPTQEVEEVVNYFMPLEYCLEEDRITIELFVQAKGWGPATTSVTRCQVLDVLEDALVHSSVVAAYMEFICQRGNEINHTEGDDKEYVVLETFAADALRSRGRGEVIGQSAQNNMYGKIGPHTRFILIPILLDQHYFIVCVDRRKLVIKSYNSMAHGKEEEECVKQLLPELKLEMYLRKMVSLAEQFEYEHFSISPRLMQKNNVDCAIFIILFVDTFCRNKPVDFTQEDVTRVIRMHIATDIIRGYMTIAKVSSTRKYFPNQKLMARMKKIMARA